MDERLRMISADSSVVEVVVGVTVVTGGLTTLRKVMIITAREIIKCMTSTIREVSNFATNLAGQSSSMTRMRKKNKTQIASIGEAEVALIVAPLVAAVATKVPQTAATTKTTTMVKFKSTIALNMTN